MKLFENDTEREPARDIDGTGVTELVRDAERDSRAEYDSEREWDRGVTLFDLVKDIERVTD